MRGKKYLLLTLDTILKRNWVIEKGKKLVVVDPTPKLIYEAKV